MIEIRITGNTPEEAIVAMAQYANVAAVGLNVINSQREQMARDTEAVSVEQGMAKSAPNPEAKPKKVTLKPKAAPEAKQADIEDAIADNVFDDEVVVEEVNPVPKNVEELRALVMKVHAKIGATDGSAIVREYANKVSEVPAANYAELSAKLHAALA